MSDEAKAWDMFAAAALPGITARVLHIAKENDGDETEFSDEEYAGMAANLADALLAERRKRFPTHAPHPADAWDVAAGLAEVERGEVVELTHAEVDALAETGNMPHGVECHINAEPSLSPEAARALRAVIRAAYERLRTQETSVEPYWRGPEDAPILSRPYDVTPKDS